MAMDGRIPTTFEAVFPHGAYMLGKVTPARDFKRSTRDDEQQEVVRDAKGNPVLDDQERPIRLWNVDVIEALDEDVEDESRGETKFRVKVASVFQPVPPPGLPGASGIRPVVLEGLELNAWVNRDRCKVEDNKPHRCRGRISWSLFATGIAAPGGVPVPEPVAAARNGSGS